MICRWCTKMPQGRKSQVLRLKHKKRELMVGFRGLQSFKSNNTWEHQWNGAKLLRKLNIIIPLIWSHRFLSILLFIVWHSYNFSGNVMHVYRMVLFLHLEGCMWISLDIVICVEKETTVEKSSANILVVTSFKACKRGNRSLQENATGHVLSFFFKGSKFYDIAHLTLG